MIFFEIIKAILYGILQGITEWLPISSTGHMIILERILPFSLSDDFFNMFKVVIQFGSILAILVLYRKKLNPFRIRTVNGQKERFVSKKTLRLWLMVLIGAVPAGVVGLLLDDIIDTFLSGVLVVAFTLIFYGVAFIVVERRNEGKEFRVNSVYEIDPKTALRIGCFQVLALIPGTSRSGSTILGASLLGVSRTAAAEFSFFLAIPVMFGASFLKLIKYASSFLFSEIVVLFFGMAVAFLVSLVAVRFLIGFVRRHSFESFGWYRIGLGILLLLLYLIF
ncbi:MAG: undecaprenyl-diphosphate phosphatase [Clostridia bacterium]|nr:undecaprenyl-diphosphate phosphatase [Clostridia bacterium]